MYYVVGNAGVETADKVIDRKWNRPEWCGDVAVAVAVKVAVVVAAVAVEVAVAAVVVTVSLVVPFSAVVHSSRTLSPKPSGALRP